MQEKILHLTILSPEKEIFSGNIERVTLPGSAGSFTVLPNHAPIVSILQKGTLSYVSGGQEQSLEIQSGFMEMSNGTVSVCIS
ncbi:MAG: ATP synthase F1 subunit epsilon [Bacteroides sp.]|nr:ATP synthase F1 subunit epsilon [Bacteroides sp.]